jgi:hypothetical protein
VERPLPRGVLRYPHIHKVINKGDTFMIETKDLQEVIDAVDEVTKAKNEIIKKCEEVLSTEPEFEIAQIVLEMMKGKRK